jgi:hypothetical protein
VAHKTAGIRIREHPVYFHCRKPCIQWNCDHSEPAARIHQLDVLRSVGEQEGKPITDAKALPAQCRRDRGDALFQLRKI